MPKTMVVLPTYNEAENLPLMVDSLLALPVNSLQILVVDDNSPDGTGQIADELMGKYAGKVFVMHRKEKEGLGKAYIDGFKCAIQMDADYIVQMDSDFSHQPKYLPDMLATIETHDMVIGSRYVRGGSVDENWGFHRKLLSWFANRVYVRTLLGIPVNDSTGGFRVWRRQTLIGLDLDRVRSNGYIFQVEITYITCRLGFKVAEVPIHFPDRVRGHSKMDTGIAMEAVLRVLQVRHRHHALTPQMRRSEAYP